MHRKNLEELQINPEEMNGPKSKVKNLVKQRIQVHFRERMQEGSNKSKVAHLLSGRKDWVPRKREKYLETLNRMDASSIFQARTRMLEIKSNFKKKYENNILCRACGTDVETQRHVLEECKKIHEDGSTMTKSDDYFSNDTETLKKAANNIQRSLQVLEKQGKEQTARPQGTL